MKIMSASSDFSKEIKLVKDCFKLNIDLSTRLRIAKARCTVWVASGLSKVAGECGRRMLQNWARIPSQLATPLEYCSSDYSAFLPIMVSYHGQNSDILSVGKSIIKFSHKQAILLSGYEQTPVQTYLEKNSTQVHLVSLPFHKEDKRFVAVQATWAMAALSLQLAYSVSAHGMQKGGLVELIEPAYETALRKSQAASEAFFCVPDWPSRKWIFLGGGTTTAALFCWEAMLAEGALLSVVISDMKDYTHGRYLSAFRENNVGFVLLTDDKNAGLGNIIKQRFSKVFPIIEIKSQGSEIFSLCQHLFQAAFVTSALAEFLGQNIASPPKPKIVKSWRNWGLIKPYSGHLEN